MKNKFITIAVILCWAFCILNCSAQTLSPKVTPAAGGIFTGGGKSLSWTLGEPFHKTLQGGNKMFTQGFQQPYILLSVLNLKAFIQGFYIGSGTMRSTLYDLGESTDPTATDTVTIELWSPANLSVPAYSQKGIIHSDGTVVLVFPAAVFGNSYYIVFRHRNSLETWSKNPLLFNTTSLSFDFTSP